MTAHVLAITQDGTTDWQTAGDDVNVVEVDFDHLVETDDVFVQDEIRDLARRVKAMPDSIPWKRDVIDRLKGLYDDRKIA